MQKGVVLPNHVTIDIEQIRWYFVRSPNAVPLPVAEKSSNLSSDGLFMDPSLP
jgi:hypothetical protein